MSSHSVATWCLMSMSRCLSKPWRLPVFVLTSTWFKIVAEIAFTSECGSILSICSPVLGLKDSRWVCEGPLENLRVLWPGSTLKIHISKKWGFTKFNADKFEDKVAEKHLILDGCGVKYLPNHSLLDKQGLSLSPRLEYSGVIIAHCSLDLLGSNDPSTSSSRVHWGCRPGDSHAVEPHMSPVQLFWLARLFWLAWRFFAQNTWVQVLF
ncbi:60S ribosomal protein L10-like [Plecturocebus cupreus]